MTEPSLSYEVEARIVRAGVSEIQAKQERITFDSSPGMSEELPGPAELLCSAFAACVLKNVERFSEMLPFAQRGASVRVTAERQQTPPRFTAIRYELRVLTDEPPQRVELLQRNLAKYGTVYNTLAATCDVTGTVVAISPGAPGA
ncbi:MAG: OsmC family protein [Solirubrobacteraceae bacterium]